jgi:hypothetical protein
MCDDKRRAAKSEQVDDRDDEVRYLTAWYGLSNEQARELIALVGNDCRKLDEAAEKLSA